MARSLLDYTQDILSSLDGDEVNSIGDTVESRQVVSLIKQCYEELVIRADLNEHYGLFELIPSNTSEKPTLMYRPDNVLSILWLKYNCETEDNEDDAFKKVDFLPLDIFLDRMHTLSASADNVGTFTHTVDSDSLTFFYLNDKAPQYYTTFDDSTLIFDSFDSEVDTTLQKTKTLAYGKKSQEWQEIDTFIPFLDEDVAALLLHEAKALCFAEMKQVAHDRAERSASRLWGISQRNKRGVNQDRTELDRAPNYGR